VDEGIGTMGGTYADKSAVPWWAAFGAPLVGVPILVALLAFGSGGHGDAGRGAGAETGYATEQAEALQAGIELPPVSVDASGDARI